MLAQPNRCRKPLFWLACSSSTEPPWMQAICQHAGLSAPLLQAIPAIRSVEKILYAADSGEASSVPLLFT